MQNEDLKSIRCGQAGLVAACWLSTLWVAARLFDLVEYAVTLASLQPLTGGGPYRWPAALGGWEGWW